MLYDAGKCDIAVIGAGHAGIEAALACARLGLDTVCFTVNLDSVGNMPCNPAIGGTAKGISCASSTPSVGRWREPPTGPAYSTACSTRQGPGRALAARAGRQAAVSGDNEAHS